MGATAVECLNPKRALALVIRSIQTGLRNFQYLLRIAKHCIIYAMEQTNIVSVNTDDIICTKIFEGLKVIGKDHLILYTRLSAISSALGSNGELYIQTCDLQSSISGN